MKQQQAGIIEAKAAIKRADESVRQGRSIIVFTVFAIFFVKHLIELRGLTLTPPAPTILPCIRIRNERSRVK
jgi:hypothetical protein